MRILLDVDGVLNAVTDAPGPHWDTWRGERVRLTPSPLSRGFMIRWAPAVCEFLTAMHDDGAEILWLTTWERSAFEMLGPALGLPTWRLAGQRNHMAEEDGEWWKLPIARALWEWDHKPFVWIDDDLGYAPEAHAWLQTLPEGSSLAIAPNWAKGITPDHIAQIRNFVA